MNFEQHSNLLSSFLLENGFLISDTVKNYIHYDSKIATLVFSYDEREDSFAVYIGRKNEDLSLLTDEILINIFNENEYKKPGKSVAENLIIFLKNKGKPILDGDIEVLLRLEEYANQLAKEYCDGESRKQQISIADDAWSKKDYLKFIDALDQIDRAALTNTYLIKYEFAKKKLEN